MAEGTAASQTVLLLHSDQRLCYYSLMYLEVHAASTTTKIHLADAIS